MCNNVDWSLPNDVPGRALVPLAEHCGGGRGKKDLSYRKISAEAITVQLQMNIFRNKLTEEGMET